MGRFDGTGFGYRRRLRYRARYCPAACRRGRPVRVLDREVPPGTRRFGTSLPTSPTTRLPERSAVSKCWMASRSSSTARALARRAELKTTTTPSGNTSSTSTSSAWCGSPGRACRPSGFGTRGHRQCRLYSGVDRPPERALCGHEGAVLSLTLAMAADLLATSSA